MSGLAKNMKQSLAFEGQNPLNLYVRATEGGSPSK